MIKVSVLVVTYNHSKYIAQALDSALSQDTYFEFEIVIGDDCSTDGAREIIKDYAARYPNIIKAFLHETNLGPAINPGSNNYRFILKECTGEYIAFLEGDDYWTDPSKLQKQVDFLDKNPEFAICFHNVKVVNEIENRLPYLVNPSDQKPNMGIQDIIRSNIISTPSVLIRKAMASNLPEWYFSLYITDWPLYLIMAQKGKIKYLNEVMAVYRIHKHGIWSGISNVKQAMYILEMYYYLYHYLDKAYKPLIKALIFQNYVYLTHNSDANHFPVELNITRYDRRKRRLHTRPVTKNIEGRKTRESLIRQKDFIIISNTSNRIDRAAFIFAEETQKQNIDLKKFNDGLIKVKDGLEEQYNNWQNIVSTYELKIKELETWAKEMEDGIKLLEKQRNGLLKEIEIYKKFNYNPLKIWNILVVKLLKLKQKLR